jgi:hypothetical protein
MDRLLSLTDELQALVGRTTPEPGAFTYLRHAFTSCCNLAVLTVFALLAACTQHPALLAVGGIWCFVLLVMATHVSWYRRSLHASAVGSLAELWNRQARPLLAELSPHHAQTFQQLAGTVRRLQSSAPGTVARCSLYRALTRYLQLATHHRQLQAMLAEMRADPLVADAHRVRASPATSEPSLAEAIAWQRVNLWRRGQHRLRQLEEELKSISHLVHLSHEQQVFHDAQLSARAEIASALLELEIQEGALTEASLLAAPEADAETDTEGELDPDPGTPRSAPRLHEATIAANHLPS